VPGVSFVLAFVIMAPLLAPGFVLDYDMAFVPRPRLSRELLGLGTGLPRNVPFGLLAGLLSRVVSGMVVQKLVLVGIVAAGAWGTARLLTAARPAARAAAAVLFVWNPLVYERLLLGQAAFLLSYATLPWVVCAAERLRRAEPGAPARLVVAIGLAAFASPYGGIIAAGTALAVVAWPSDRRRSVLPGAVRTGVLERTAVTLAAAAVVNLPWLLPSILRPGGAAAPAAGFDLFRSRSDSPLGLFGSLLSLGGTWRTDLAPPGRDTVAWVLAFLLILAVAVAGWIRRSRDADRGGLFGLTLVAVVGFALAYGVALPGLGHAVRWLGVHGPGGGILRDAQKFIAPLALLLAVSFGHGVEGVLARAGQASWHSLAGVALAVLPVALVPTLAWGASNRLFVSDYPADWTRARAVMAADPPPGAVLVFPWHLYLPLGWNRDRVVIEPASSFFTRRAVVSDALEVGHTRLPPEDRWAILADPVVRSGRPLALRLPSLGIRYVLLLREADVRAFEPRVAGLRSVLEGPNLQLFRVQGPVTIPRLPEPPAAPVIGGDVVAAVSFLGAVAARRRRSRALAGPEPSP